MNNKILVIFLWTQLIFNSQLLLAEKLISDSLVNHLSCENLSIQSIHSQIRDDAFAIDRHIPIKNWSFPTGPYSLGVCWSLSHTQRIFFYLARWSPHFSNNPQYNSTDGINILNLVRGSRPIKGGFNDIREIELSQLYTFDFQSFSTENGLFADIINGIWDPLHGFFPDPGYVSNAAANEHIQTEEKLDLSIDYENSVSIDGLQTTVPFKIEDGKLFRNFKLEIERYQRWRFHRFQNSKMVTDPVPRPKEINQQTTDLLMQMLQQTNLPLVNIKANFNTQHILVVKEFQKNNEGIRFTVYDSNGPSGERFFEYDNKTQQFKAPEIIKSFRGITNANQNVSVYIVDSDEQDKIDEALFNYYKEQCQSL